MNKLLLGAMLFSVGFGYGQTIFEEDFEASTSLPTGWKQYNVDGNTPASQRSYMGNNAWIIKASGDSDHGNVALSTSWYSPAGKSDDWLVTPLIALTGTNVFLEFDNVAPDASFPDDYEVWLSTTGDSVANFLNGGVKLLSATIGNKGVWALRTIDLSAYAGQDVHIAFRNVANDQNLLYIDNVIVRVALSDDARLVSVKHNRYGKKSEDNSITYSVTNRGTNAITKLRVSYTDGGTPVEENVVVNIPTGQTKNVSIPTPLNYATVVEKNITHTITKVNENDDLNPSDNTKSSKFNTVSEVYEKNVVFEEGTGTWCGWCVRGLVGMAYMEENYPDFIGIAVHNDDPMTISAYDDALGLSAFPGGYADRVYELDLVDQDEFVQVRQERKDLVTPTKVEAAITSNGNSVTIEATATFNTIVSNNKFRLAAVVTEDKVSGTASGYKQANYYSGGDFGAMGGYEDMSDPVPAADMVYNHVARALLGGFDGQANSVPTNVTDGSTASYTFNYTIPGATSNKNNMHVVVMLIDNETGEILNGKKYGLAVASTEEVVSQNSLNVYPNPATESLNISLDNQVSDYTVSVYDISGKVLLQKSITNDMNVVASTTLDISILAKGSYMVSFATSTQSYTKHFVKE